MFRIGSKLIIDEKFISSIVSKGSTGFVASCKFESDDKRVIPYTVIFTRFGKTGKIRFSRKSIRLSMLKNNNGNYVSHTAKRCRPLNLLTCEWYDFFAFELALLYSILDMYKTSFWRPGRYEANRLLHEADVLTMLIESNGKLFKFLFKDDDVINTTTVSYIEAIMHYTCDADSTNLSSYCINELPHHLSKDKRSEELTYIAKIKSIVRKFEDKQIKNYTDRVLLDMDQHILAKEEARELIDTINREF